MIAIAVIADVPTTSFSTLDWIVLAVYFVGTMAIGVLFAKRSSSVDGFTAAGRSLPGWVCGLSIFATYLSSISYLALPGKSFSGNWNPFVFSLAIPIATWVAVTWFVPYYRSRGEVSAYAALETRFGVWARICVSVFYLLTQIARMGVVMYLMALPMQVLLGWDIRTLILATGVAVTVYAMVGGITAVIWADAIQAIVLMVGAFVCLGTMIYALPNGFSTVIDVASESEKFSLGSWSLTDFTAPTVLVVLLFSLVENFKNFGIDQSYIQRYIASDSDAAAKRSLWLGGLLYVPVSALFFFIGTTLYAYHAAQPGELVAVKEVVARQQLLQSGEEVTRERVTAIAADLDAADIGDRVFPYYIVSHMPAGLRGLLIAAVFAAAMSTVSTSLNSSATLVLEDYVKRFLRPGLSETASLFVLRLSTVVWGIFGTVTALILVSLTQSALDMWWTLSAVFGGAMVGLFLLGIFTSTQSKSALVATFVGIVAIGWLVFSKTDAWAEASPATVNPLDSYLTAVIGSVVIVGLGPIYQRLFGQPVTAISTEDS